MDNDVIASEGTSVPSEVSSESSINEAPAQSSTPAPSLKESFNAKAAEISAAQSGNVAKEVADAYQPNYKLQVHELEREIEEWARPYIKDKESEEKFRELYQKAYGLEYVKPKYERFKSENERLSGETKNYEGIVETLRENVKNGDYDAFFKNVNVPVTEIYKWVAGQIQRENLPPEKKMEYDRMVQLQRENSELNRKLSTTSQQASQAETQQLNYELQTELSKPDVNSVMREFDQRQGRIGAFREAIIIHAEAIQNATGQNVTAAQAVQSLLTLRSNISGSTPGVVGQPNQASEQVVAKPVIPNFKARGGTPVKKIPKSIDDLRQMAKERIRELEG